MSNYTLYDLASLVLTPNAYKTSRIYSSVPNNGSGDFTFSRASVASRINSSGMFETVANNIPRLTYPFGSGCPAFQVSQERTNIFQNSEPATQPAGSTVIAASFAINDWGIGLDGKVILQDNSTLRLFYNTSGLPTSGVATMCAIVKRTDLGIPVERNEGPAVGDTDFFLTLNNPGTVISVTKQNLGNGLWFFVKKVNITGVGGGVGILKDTGQRNTAIEASAIMVCVGDLNLTPADYVKTTGSSITAFADAPILTNATTLIGQTEGSIYFETEQNNFALGDIFCLYQDNSNYILINHFTSGSNFFVRALVRVANNFVVNIQTQTFNGILKIGFSYANNNFSLIVNGGIPVTSSSGAVPTTSIIRIFTGTAFASGFANGILKMLALYTRQLTNAELIALTT